MIQVTSEQMAIYWLHLYFWPFVARTGADFNGRPFSVSALFPSAGKLGLGIRLPLVIARRRHRQT